MIRLIASLFFVTVSLGAFGANWFVEGTVWEMDASQDHSQPSTGEAPGTIPDSYYLADPVEDEGGVTWLQMYYVLPEGESRPVALISTDGERVYSKDADGRVGLLYDFALQPGQTVECTYYQDSDEAYEIVGLGTSTSDRVPGVELILYRQPDSLIPDYGEVWIDGVGGLYGPMENLTPNTVGWSRDRLKRVTHNGDVIVEIPTGNTALPQDIAVPEVTTVPVYYNLQGQRLAAPPAGQIAVERTGIRSRTVIVR